MHSAHSLVFELYTEELPAFYQRNAISQFRVKAPLLLKESLLRFQEVYCLGTARRLVLYISALEEYQDVLTESMKGPPKKLCFDADGQYSLVFQKFIERVGLPLEQIKEYFQNKKVFFSDDENAYLYASISKGGSSILQILPSVLSNLIQSIKFPKMMHWGITDMEYPRPIIHYFSMYGSSTLPLDDSPFFKKLSYSTYPTYGLFTQQNTGNQNTTKIDIKNAEDYMEVLQQHGIQVDSEKREKLIFERLEKVAHENKCEIIENTSLLKEVNFLLEHPFIVKGEFDKKYLALPKKLILSEMEQHQKYFGLQKQDGTLINEFLIVANIHDTGDKNLLQKKIYNVKTGNERVLRARLSDAEFFFLEDQKDPLIKKVSALKNVVYQEGMGSLFDKKERIKKIAIHLVPLFGDKLLQNTDLIYRSADLLKADLTTHLVDEFDHLQGYIGSVYAKLQGESDEVVSAIEEHYWPLAEGEEMPKTPMSILMSLSDKLDNIISGFILNKQPKSNQDPLAIRRQALCILQIILKHELSVNLKNELSSLLAFYLVSGKEKVASSIWKFFEGRIFTIFEKRGISKQMIRAGLGGSSTDVLDIYKKIEVLLEMDFNKDFITLMSLLKRMDNILKKEKISISDSHNNTVDTSLFEQKEENALYRWATEFANLVMSKKESYSVIFSKVVQAQDIIHQFFDNVLVNHSNTNIKENRLQLLVYIISHIYLLIDLKELK